MCGNGSGNSQSLWGRKTDFVKSRRGVGLWLPFLVSALFAEISKLRWVGTWLLKNKTFACLRGINSLIFLEDNAVMWPVFAKFRLMHGQMTTGSGLQTPV